MSTFSIKQKREQKVRERKQYQAACMQQQQQFYRIESEKNMRKSTKRRKKEQWTGEEKQHIKLAYLISKEVTNTRDKKWTTKKTTANEEVGENMKEEENESETGVALNSQVNHHKRTPSWLFSPFPNWGDEK